MTERKSEASRARRPKPKPDLRQTIIETAMDLAERGSWSRLRLTRVAEELGISCGEIQVEFRDKDAVADAWFEGAWQAMLAAPQKDFAGLPAEERLYLLLCRWFDALAPRHRVTGEMLKEKIYPSHPHHWVPLIFNLSRTIQWLRDAAHLDAEGVRRQVEEVGLTALFLATLQVWMRDESPGQTRTKDHLRRRLSRADRLMTRLWRPRSREAAS